MSTPPFEAAEPSVPGLSGVKKRVLHCAYSGLGGHAAVLFTLLSERMREEFEHFVVFFGVEDLCEDYARTCTRLGVPFVFIKKKGRIALQPHREVLRKIAEFGPDVIMINGTPLAIPILSARRLQGHDWSVVVRESQPNHQKTLAEWIGSYMAARSADAVVYLTKEYRDEVEARIKLPVQRRGRACVIPNGVDMTDYDHRAPAREPATLRIAMVSRLVPLKNHSALIDAVRILIFERKHNNLEVLLAGDGPTRAELEQRAVAAGLKGVVTFTGTLGKVEVIDLLRKVDIYAHCTFGEGMSNSILQAMASGLPIVASDVRGVSNMLRNGTDALLVPVDNAEALADALETLIRSPGLRSMLGGNARRRVEEELSQQRVVEEYRNLFMQFA